MTARDANVLQYHFGDHDRYSIDYIKPDKQAMKKMALERTKKMVGPDVFTQEEIRPAPVFSQQDQINGRTLYLLYVNKSQTTIFEGMETVEDYQKWIDEHFTELEIAFLTIVGLSFGNVLEMHEEREEWLELYKEMELEKLHSILDRVSWDKDVVSVAGDLLSQFIQAHPMPNTNHRTGISVLESYLRAGAPDGFTIPKTGNYERWEGWVQEYITDSKRLLTLRQKTPLFRYAHKYGYDIVERKEGIQILLNNYDLKRDDHFDYYSRQHVICSTEFVETVLEQTGREDLNHQSDDGKTAFLTRLDQEVGEIDLPQREL